MKAVLLWHIKPGTGKFGSMSRVAYIIDMLRKIIDEDWPP